MRYRVPMHVPTSQGHIYIIITLKIIFVNVHFSPKHITIYGKNSNELIFVYLTKCEIYDMILLSMVTLRAVWRYCKTYGQDGTEARRYELNV